MRAYPSMHVDQALAGPRKEIDTLVLEVEELRRLVNQAAKTNGRAAARLKVLAYRVAAEESSSNMHFMSINVYKT